MADQQPAIAGDIEEDLVSSHLVDLTPMHTSTNIVVDTNDHIYETLSDHKSQIRLIQILPDRDETKIRCRTEIHDLNMLLNFVALSYTWGALSAEHIIELDGKNFFVRKNLWRFLNCARKQKEIADNLIWIDAVCIDQRNLSERTCQVGLMPEIYKTAKRVIVWLGPAHSNSDDAMNCLSDWREGSQMGKIWSGKSGQAIGELCVRSYWTRLWIFQELLLAQESRMMCGHKIISWRDFQKFLVHMYYSATPGTRVWKRLACRTTVTSPAMMIVLQIVQNTTQRSLVKLILATQELNCAEIRDKVYGLLGVAVIGHTNIIADYSIPIYTLFNCVIREHYDTQAPPNIGDVFEKCQNLSRVFGIDPELTFALHSSYQGRFPILSDNDTSFISKLLGPRAGFILWATYYNHRTLLKLCFEEAMNSISLRDILLESIRCRNDYATIILLEIDGDVQILKEEDKEAAFRSAAIHGLSSIVEALIGHVNVDSRDDPDQSTALHLSSYHGHLAVVLVLVNIGNADIDVLNWEGENALHRASWAGHSEVIDFLVRTSKVDVNAQDDDKYTALHSASLKGYSEVVEILLKIGKADVNIRNKFGETALHLSSKYGWSQATRALIEIGKAEVNIQNRDGSTALSLASQAGHLDVVKILLEAGRAEVNAQDKDKRTALHWASFHNHLGVVEVLIKVGNADVHIKDAGQATALDLAKSRKNTRMISTLVSCCDPLA